MTVATMTCPDATPVGLVIARLVAPLPVVALLLAATKLIAAWALPGAIAKLRMSTPRARIVAQ